MKPSKKTADKPAVIAYFSSFGNMGSGGQESLFLLTTHLNRKKFYPLVVVPHQGSLFQRLMERDIEVIVLDLPKIIRVHKSLPALYRLWRLASNRRIDLFHTDGPRTTFYAGIIGKWMQIPVIWHVRASSRDPWDCLLVSLSSNIILVANALRTRFQRYAGHRQFHTIYNGVTLSDFNPSHSGHAIRRRYGIDDQSLVIVSMGRIEPSKGQHHLIEACARIWTQLPSAYVLMIGDISAPDYYRACVNKALEQNLQDRVIFTGCQPQVAPFLEAADIVVLASLTEAFPRTIIEAMAAGRPVIASDVGGCSESVEHGVTGFLTPAGDSPALADRILWLAGNPKLRQAMGQAGRLRAEQQFDMVNTIRQTESLYTEILESGSHPFQ